MHTETHRSPISPLLASATVLAVLCVAVLFVTFNGGISVGASNHAGLLPVVRRLLDPHYLPGDFNIELRLYHHRVFAYLLAGFAALFGELRGVVIVHCLGALLLSAALLYLCRTLRLSLLSYMVAGVFLATGFLWTGRGLEENDFLGNPEIQPPLFAHAFVLLLTAQLIRGRYRPALFCAGLAVFFHLQIGVIASVMCAPVLLVQLRKTDWREWLRLAACYLVPASFALSHLLGMLQRGLLKPAARSVTLIEYIDFRHPHHFGLFSWTHMLWVTAHVIFLVALWYWAWRGVAGAGETSAYAVLSALSVMLCLLAAAHFADYYLLKQGKLASLQSIRLSPLLTVFGTLGLLTVVQRVAMQFAVRYRYQYGWRGWLVPVSACALLLAGGLWGVRVARDPESEFFLGVNDYRAVTGKRGSKKAWAELGQWIRANGPRDTVYLTPPTQDGFTSLTDRSNVVEFKINPDGALQLDEWYERLRAVAGGTLPQGKGFENRASLAKGYANLTPEQFTQLAVKYQAGFAVVSAKAKLPFEAIYANEHFQLVRLPAGK